jgi:hypothetical protein
MGSTSIGNAEQRASEIVAIANGKSETVISQARSMAQALTNGANLIKQRAIDEADSHLRQTREIVERLRQTSKDEADELLKKVRAEAKEKSERAEHNLSYATIEAQEIVAKAEKKAVSIGGKAYEALKKADFYEKTADAMYNVTKGYGSRFMVPPESILDAWA